MRRALPLLALANLALFSALPMAQAVERYRLEKTDDGYVRMDTETGAMSICEERDDELVCRDSTEAAQASGTSEVDALKERIRALETRVDSLEKAPAISALPSEEEFDRSLSYMQRFFRTFMDIVKEEEAGTGSGQKT